MSDPIKPGDSRHWIHGITFDRLSAALFFAALGCAACFMPAQSDTWWQLRAGQEIVDSGSVQLRDTFSHTVANGYWPDHEWLSQVIFYGLYRMGGLPLLTAVAAAVVTVTWLIVWSLTPGGLKTRLVLSTLAMGPFATEWSLRPQIFSLFLLALTIWLLVHRRHWFLPPLFAIWANLHGGVMLGVIVMASHAAASIVAERRLFTRAAIVGGISAAMTALTPLGFSLWTEIPASLGRLREYGVLEWRPPSLADPTLATFWPLAAAFVVLVVVTKPWHATKNGDSVLVWGALALLPVALNASRNVPSLLLLLVPAVGTLLESTSLRMPRRAGRRERPALNVAILTVACVCGLAAVAYGWAAELPRLRWRPLRPEMIAALTSCPERLYNRYDEGGYIIWFVPERKVFIDSRQDPYPPELMREHIRIETSGDYEEAFHRHAIRCAFGPTNSLLTRRLAENQWQPLYRDANWTVLAHP